MANSLNRLIQDKIRENWLHPALSDLNGDTLTFAEVARRIIKLHIVFERVGLKPGDRVALCGKNSANWAVSFLSVISYGGVAVPLLHDFKADTLRHLVEHSEAKLIFTDSRIIKDIEAETIPTLTGGISLDDFTPLLSDKENRLNEAENNLNMEFAKRFPDRFLPENFTLSEDNPENLCVINYTSGSTGFSKGVMLPRRAIYSNLKFAVTNINYLHPGDGIVLMLPLAHMFGLSIEFLFPFLKGCHITFLGRIPAPSVILKVFAEVRPKLIIAVPLILEKVVKSKIMPALQKPAAKFMLSVPILRNKVYSRVRKGLMDAFGGNLIQFIVGGAPLNHEVEELLVKAGFPVTVGYGMTECGPLIAYAPWDERPFGSCGRLVDGMEMRIDSDDPEHKAGELWVKGENVMQGYYKAKDATESVFRDGWMNTGDLCQIDKDGFLYIRGRNKTMILGASGQNIYPEEIEARLNNMPLVLESLIVDRNGRLIALIVPDAEDIKKNKIPQEKVIEQMNLNLKKLNAAVASYEKVAGYELMDEEFVKTPKRSIKRFMYK